MFAPIIEQEVNSPWYFIRKPRQLNNNWMLVCWIYGRTIGLMHLHKVLYSTWCTFKSKFIYITLFWLFVWRSVILISYFWHVYFSNVFLNYKVKYKYLYHTKVFGGKVYWHLHFTLKNIFKNSDGLAGWIDMW